MNVIAKGKNVDVQRQVTAREALLITTLIGSCMLGSVGVIAMATAAGRLALLAAIGSALSLAVALSLLEDAGEQEDDAAGDGEVANLSEEEFDRLVEEVERKAAAGPQHAHDDDDAFEQLVRDALDELPAFVQARLGHNVAVIVSDRGHLRGHLGLYHGGTVAGAHVGHKIVIYRDTLVRAYGHDPDELRRQVAITVRHEVAHHLGASERHVADLGL